MAINPMLAAGANSMQQGIKALDSVAQEIAELNIKDNSSASDKDGQPLNSFSIEDVAEAVIDMKVYERQVQASAKVVQTADEMLGFLLDVHA